MSCRLPLPFFCLLLMHLGLFHRLFSSLCFFFLAGADPEHLPERSETERCSCKSNYRYCKCTNSETCADLCEESDSQKDDPQNDSYVPVNAADVLVHFITSNNGFPWHIRNTYIKVITIRTNVNRGDKRRFPE
jgi:hypothetical protein